MDALTEKAVRAIDEELPNLSGYEWDEHLLRFWTAYRHVLRERPILADLTVLRTMSIARSPAASQLHAARMDREFAVLNDAGFTPEEALRSYAALSCFTRGCIQLERAYAIAVSPAGTPLTLEQFPVNLTVLPAFRDAAPYWTPSLASDADFDFGVEVVIGGLRAILKDRTSISRA